MHCVPAPPYILYLPDYTYIALHGVDLAQQPMHSKIPVSCLKMEEPPSCTAATILHKALASLQSLISRKVSIGHTDAEEKQAYQQQESAKSCSFWRGLHYWHDLKLFAKVAARWRACNQLSWMVRKQELTCSNNVSSFLAHELVAGAM